jgi:hypothetical protein
VQAFGVTAAPLDVTHASAGTAAAKSGTTTAQSTPTDAYGISPVANVSCFLFLMWVLNSIAVISHLDQREPLAVDVEPVVSFLGASFACRTAVTSRTRLAR